MANQVKAPKVTVIDPATPEKARLRVATYARVSSDSADQLNSYLAQVDYYTRHIGENPDWELADIYADEGISGLDTRKRDEFNRMMADCRAGKSIRETFQIQMILQVKVDVVTTATDLLTQPGICLELMNPLDKILVHIVTQDAQFRDRMALNRVLDVGIPQAIGNLR